MENKVKFVFKLFQFDDTAAVSSDESFSGDYMPDSALHSDSETLVNKQKLSSLENKTIVSKSFDDLTMDSGNERVGFENPFPL